MIVDAKTGLEKKQKRHSTVNNQSRKGLSDISNTMGSDGNGNGRPSQTDGDKENIKLMPSPRFKDHVAQLVTVLHFISSLSFLCFSFCS